MDLIPENVSALAAKLGAEPEVIAKFLTDAAASEEVKPFAEKLGTLHVFSNTDFTTRITNERQQAASEAGNTAKGLTYGAVDRRVKETTGIEKNVGESTLDYQERAFREKFSKTSDSEELQRVRDEATAAKQLLTAKTTEFDTFKSTVEKESAKARIAGAFKEALGTVALADPSQGEYLQFKFEQKYSTKHTEAGIEYTDRATGEVQRNPNTAGLATAADLLPKFAPTVQGLSLKKPSAAESSGFKIGSTTITEGATTMDYAALASYDDFKATLAKNGIPAGSDVAGKLYAGLKEKRPDLIPK